MLTLLLLSFPSLGALQEPEEFLDVKIPEGVIEDSGEWLNLRFNESTQDGLTLRQFIKIAQVMTGRNFTIDEAGNANTKNLLDMKRILLYGDKRIRKSDFYSFFQIMLKIHDFVCVQQGSGNLAVIVITLDNQSTRNKLIIPNALFVEAKQVEEFRDEPGTYIATVFRLRFAQAQSMGVNLRQALNGGASGNSPSGGTSIMPLPNENALLLQGFGPSLAAAIRMLTILDVEPFREQPVFVRIPLEETSAEDLVNILEDLLEELEPGISTASAGRRNTNNNSESSSQPEIQTKIVPNPRDNSLLVVAEEKKLDLIRKLVAQLDVKVDQPETHFRIYRMKNVAVGELAESLERFLDSARTSEERRNRGAGNQATSTQLAEQELLVEAEEETNSLLITGSRTKMEELERLLVKLDRRQPQVLIETALIEVSEDFSRDLGFEYASVNYPERDGSQTGFGFTSMGLSTLTDSDGDGTLDTRILDSSRAGFTAGILDGTQYGIPFLLAAAQNSTSANILSVPSILVTNNQGATVNSTDQIPYGTSQATSGVGVTTGFAGYEEAGIKLSISPSISEDQYLRLGISLEISTFRGASSPGDTIPPPKAVRTLDTTVYLPDGATMWIGGIVRDDLTTADQGIPGLSDLPIVGWLFGSETKTKIKTTLFFFCTPRILNGFAELDDISLASKAEAADVIGLDRVRRIDPRYRANNPLDVILPMTEDGPAQSGMLDPNAFAAPIFTTPSGAIPEGEFRQPAAAPEAPLEFVPLSPEADGRNLPEGLR